MKNTGNIKTEQITLITNRNGAIICIMALVNNLHDIDIVYDICPSRRFVHIL